MKRSKNGIIVLCGVLTAALFCFAVNGLHLDSEFEIIHVDPKVIDESDTSAAYSSDGRININTADSEALQEITGIGSKMAQRIIEYREEHGEFKQIQDIMKVQGIGQAVFDSAKDHICVADDGRIMMDK